jgi:hypothetical protein
MVPLSTIACDDLIPRQAQDDTQSGPTADLTAD